MILAKTNTKIYQKNCIITTVPAHRPRHHRRRAEWHRLVTCSEVLHVKGASAGCCMCDDPEPIMDRFWSAESCFSRAYFKDRKNEGHRQERAKGQENKKSPNRKKRTNAVKASRTKSREKI